MVAWIADTAQRVLALLPDSRRAALIDRLGLGDDEIAAWEGMSHKMFIPFHGDGIISQFEGYEDLEELDWEGYRAKHGNIQRLDRILRAEDKDPDDFKLAKQADTVMLFFLFSPDELRRLLEQLGYAHDPDMARRTIDYYDQRTSHGSTLSLITYAGVLAGLDPASSWQRFLEALESDLGDVQGGTTKEGIHMGVMSGTLDLLQRSYTGSSVRDGVLHFQPRLIDRLDGLAIKGHELTALAQSEGFRAPVRIAVGDQVHELGAGARCLFALPQQPDPTPR
jgi:trehalose/maltose hydrolase-like predicted phosphorylase